MKLSEKTAALMERVGCGCQGPKKETTPTEDVIWQDPLGYDPFVHGPPYMPTANMRTAAQVFTTLNVTRGNELPALLVFLRTASFVHQTHHWITRGGSYYADHLLFQRLYDGILSEIDAVAERSVGSNAGSMVADVRAQVQAMGQVLSTLGGVPESPEAMVERSLGVEQMLEFGLTKIVANMEGLGTLSRGTDNLLAGIEDKHEEHRYLLAQRLKDGMV